MIGRRNRRACSLVIGNTDCSEGAYVRV